jgi:transmembrane sensor
LAIAVGAWRGWDEAMNSTSEQILAAIAQQAGDWYAENRAGPLTHEAREEFVAWLRASPQHVEEYLGVAAVARDLRHAADDPDFDIEALLARANVAENVVQLDRPPAPPSVRLTGPRHPAVWWRAAAAAAAALTALAVSTVWSTRDGQRFGLPMTYRTAHGEQNVVRLPDGSVLTLNTDSQVTVRYTSAERVVDVERGQALFQVAHEAQRRFRVLAGSAEVVAVGTQFDVYRKPATAIVTVVAGSVAIYAGPPTFEDPGIALPEHAVRVAAGYQVTVAGQEIGLPHPVDTWAAVAWVRRQIAFANVPLGEVAAEFNRYGRDALEIDDPALRAMPISGIFNAYDTESFAAFIQTLNGVAVERTPARIRIISTTRR